VPSALFTATISSLMVTSPLASRSAQHPGRAVGATVAVAAMSPIVAVGAAAASAGLAG